MSWHECVAEREQVSLGAIAIDRSFTIIHASDGVIVESGLERGELLGTSAFDLVHPDDAARAIDVLSEVQAIPGARPRGMYRVQVSDGSYRFFSIRAMNLGEADDFVVVLDFARPTKEIRAQAFADDAVDVMRMLSEDLSLDESLEWVARVGERHVEGLQLVTTIFEADGPNRVLSRGPVPETLLELNQMSAPNELPIHVEVAFDQFSQGPWILSQKIASLDYIMPGRLTSILAGRDGAVVGYVEALRATTAAPNATEWLVHGMISRMMTAALHRYEFDRQLRRAADIDPLTGLLNRRKLLELLESDQHLAGSLLYLIDLDRFSWVNNNLGHQAGDETLVAVAHALVQVCPQQALIARLGGDEFVVWLPADQATYDLAHLGSHISKALVVPAGIGDNRVQVRASIGMIAAKAGESSAAALNRADVAMYAAKRSGGDGATLG